MSFIRDSTLSTFHLIFSYFVLCLSDIITMSFSRSLLLYLLRLYSGCFTKCKIRVVRINLSSSTSLIFYSSRNFSTSLFVNQNITTRFD
ncbi:MAG: hypothetical protein DI556_19250 [Rhodovulum sulfidophilum]|uniref:Uncharacterized protein n=1 Tax=Rhodovulum sulfidophilum TaxID=35806 RepID=A0A2W5N314_RHOSU|nr:MAG: hypothetical protein DI556_19250 [Rhodovulum sulfidophilum]